MPITVRFQIFSLSFIIPCSKIMQSDINLVRSLYEGGEFEASMRAVECASKSVETLVTSDQPAHQTFANLVLLMAYEARLFFRAGNATSGRQKAADSKRLLLAAIKVMKHEAGDSDARADVLLSFAPFLSKLDLLIARCDQLLESRKYSVAKLKQLHSEMVSRGELSPSATSTVPIPAKDKRNKKQGKKSIGTPTDPSNQHAAHDETVVMPSMQSSSTASSTPSPTASDQGPTYFHPLDDMVGSICGEAPLTS